MSVREKSILWIERKRTINGNPNPQAYATISFIFNSYCQSVTYSLIIFCSLWRTAFQNMYFNKFIFKVHLNPSYNTRSVQVSIVLIHEGTLHDTAVICKLWFNNHRTCHRRKDTSVKDWSSLIWYVSSHLSDICQMVYFRIKYVRKILHELYAFYVSGHKKFKGFAVCHVWDTLKSIQREEAINLL